MEISRYVGTTPTLKTYGIMMKIVIHFFPGTPLTERAYAMGIVRNNAVTTPMTMILMLFQNEFRKPWLPRSDLYAPADHFHGARNMPSR